MSVKSIRHLSHLCVALAAMTIVLFIYLRLHTKPAVASIGDVAVLTTPAGGINVVTWNVPAGGLEVTFDFEGTTINTKFGTSGNVRVRAGSITPRVGIRLLPNWQSSGAVVGPWGVHRMTTLYLPLWWLPVTCVALAFYFRRRARIAAGALVCDRCGYSLVNLPPLSPCPECGHAITAPTPPAATP